MENIDKQITETLKTENINFTVVHVGFTYKGDWPCDEWRVTFSKGKESLTTEYYTGTGHRILNPQYKNDRFAKIDLGKARNYLKKGETPKNEALFLKLSKTVLPEVASVLHSLMLDAQALERGFTDWCNDFGYDGDSISAFDTYRACCENGKKLQKVFSRDTLVKIEELLQDY